MIRDTVILSVLSVTVYTSDFQALGATSLTFYFNVSAAKTDFQVRPSDRYS